MGEDTVSHEDYKDTAEDNVGRKLTVVRRELQHHGSWVTADAAGVLATIMPNKEGHFRVDPQQDGSWRIWGTFGELLRISGDVSANVLAVVAAEALQESRRRYYTTFHPEHVPPPLPPPFIRRQRRSTLAAELVAAMVHGERVKGKRWGHDVRASARRIRVLAASTRAPGLGAVLKFTTPQSYYDHDEIIVVLFSGDNWPMEAWSIVSDAARDLVRPDNSNVVLGQVVDTLGTSIGYQLAEARNNLIIGPVADPGLLTTG